MGAKKDSQIVESIVLLGILNGFLYSLKFNPQTAFMNEIVSSITTILAAVIGTGQLYGLILTIIQLLPAIVLVIGVIYIFRLGGATAITAVAFGFGCGYFLISNLLISLICLFIGLVLGLYSVKSKKLPLRR
jgi:drug/metabolite transporter (DMT)-like permease